MRLPQGEKRKNTMQNMPEKRKSTTQTVSSDEEEDIPDKDDRGEDEEGSLRIDDIYIPPPPKPACSVQTTGHRLVITHISNHFFKSYTNTQVLGPLHKCFNAIIGPNGSGKSNIIDAMLFVFGYRATKIRSKKVSVLIHNSEKYQNVLSCTVTVHFAVILDKAGEDYEVIPGSAFTISRTANKDNSSYYMINGHRVQFKEVAKRLRDYGVDLDHNRFLILQGEVEQIALMKPKAVNENETGMLEYLEDIIGTQRFKEPLVKLEERVEILAEQRLEKLNRVGLVQNEMEHLKKPMEEAVQFLSTENKVVLGKNMLFQWNIYTVQEKIETTEAQHSEVAAIQNKLAEQLETLKSEKQSKDGYLKETSKKYEALEKRRDAIKEAFNAANNQDIKLQADMTQLNKTRKKSKEQLIEEQKKLEQLKRVPAENEKNIEECTKKEEQMLAKKEKLEAEKAALLVNLRGQTQELQNRKEVLQTKLIDLNKVVDETKSTLTLTESELQIYVSNEETERKKLENLQQTYEAVKRSINERNREIAELDNKIPLTAKSLQSAHRDLDAVRNEENNLIDTIRTRRNSLAETKSSMQASKSRGRVLDSLMQQKREGKCHGLFGRLGDLGAIEQKYDVAISTACGPLDNIVVDTVATAQWCIEFLKQHDIGRATFIALEKQEHLRQRCETRIKTPENVPRLFDLIRIEDDRVRTAFYYALRDTLVANDLEQASRIAYGAQRYRVVTLMGQLIETTGTMSGGGKTVSRGRMGQSVIATTASQPKDVKRMENDLQNMEETVRQLRQKQASYENQIATLQPELNAMKINLKKHTIELQSSKQQEPLLVKQLKAQENKSSATKSNPAIVKQMSKSVAEKRAAYEKAAAKAEALQRDVDEITGKIKEKTSGKLTPIEKGLKEVNGTIDKCKAEITRLSVGIKTAKRNYNKCSEKIASIEQDIKSAEHQLMLMKAKREDIEKDAQQLLESTESITEQLTGAEEEFKGVKKEVAALAKRENEIKSNKIEVDEKCRVFDKTLKNYKAEIHTWASKLEHLKLHNILDQQAEVLQIFTKEELKDKDMSRITRDVTHNEEKIKQAKPNLNAITEYTKKQAVFVERSKELQAISNKRKDMKEALDSVRRQRHQEFINGYKIIKSKLKEMYQMITLGGDADFELVDSFDPFNEGIQFNVRPPKKTWKNISDLSGGEKTLSSLALVFALHHYKPSPLYIMDEIDAALDFKNVSIVGNYIKERTKNTQFIIISLRSQMFELGNHLIGIYKTFNCTKSACLNAGSLKNRNAVRSFQETQNAVRALVNGTLAEDSALAGDDSLMEEDDEDSVIDSSMRYEPQQ